MADAMNRPAWVKSSRCGSNACVEVAKVEDRVLIRSSVLPQVAPLSFSAEEWTAFTAGVRDGEFD